MIVVIDYGMGNIASVVNMVRKAGGHVIASGDPDRVAHAEKLLLPGVGAFDRGMEQLESRELLLPLCRAVLDRQVPILGICLGMQLLSERSEEGKRPGLGWIAAETVRFQCDRNGEGLKVPHMGWNAIHPTGSDPLLQSSSNASRYYFVHSYHVVCEDPSDVVATTNYGAPFVSVLGRGNIRGTQFHPEKSHAYGMNLMKNFVHTV